MDQAINSLEMAHHEARKRILAIGSDQWAVPTPCSDWSVRALVVHMVAGANMSVELLSGKEWDRGFAQSVVAEGDQLVEEWGQRAAAELSAFSEPGALERTVKHPVAGDLPARQFIAMRTGDALIHSWDLARAIGSDETLNEALVAQVWESLQPLAPIIGEIGVFGTGPSGDVGPNAPLQARMLDLTGRRP